MLTPLWHRAIVATGLGLGLLTAAPALADQQDDLVLASSEGHAALVAALLRRHVDINGPDRKGSTALMAAARGGHMEMVQVLLNHGASVTVRDWQGRNAIMLAEERGHGGVVALLKHQQAFANDYLKTLGSPGKHTVWGGTLAVDYSQAGTTHLVYTRPHLSLPMATMVARTMGGPGLDYGQPTLEEGWVTFPPLGKDKPRVKARIRSTGYGAQSVEVWLQ